MYIGKKSMSPPRPPVDPEGRLQRTSASGKKDNAAGDRAGTADQVAGTLEAVQSVPVTAAEELPSRESVAVMAERSGGNLRSEGTANAEGSRSSDPSARMDDLTEDLTNTPGANSTDPVRSGPPLGMVYAPEQPFMRLFEPQKALSVGTIFTDLYFPFRGRSVVKEAR